MNENQFNAQPGFQQNQPLQEEKLTDYQSQSGNFQGEDTENSDRQKDFPQRTQQHDYKDPSANHNDEDEDDEVDTDEGIFDEEDETNPDSVEDQIPGVSNLGQI